MEKKVKVAPNSKEKSIIKDALMSSENEQLDLYKAIFGGSSGDDCNIAAPSNLRMDEQGATAYDKVPTGFLEAV